MIYIFKKLPEKGQVSKLSSEEKELQKQVRIREFELDSEAKIIGYFMKQLRRSKYQPVSIDLKHFYITRAINSLSQIKDTINRGILEDLIESSSGNTIH